MGFVTEATVRLTLLGAFCLERDGRAINLPTRKAASLLAYLALHPESHLREKIATLFWGDSSDERARRSLRTALASLRRGLGNNLLLTDRETVQLNREVALWVDAKEFSQSADRLEPTVVHPAPEIDLYQGDLLPGFDDEWIAISNQFTRVFGEVTGAELAGDFNTGRAHAPTRIGHCIF